jgi:hypothetical protein
MCEFFMSAGYSNIWSTERKCDSSNVEVILDHTFSALLWVVLVDVLSLVQAPALVLTYLLFPLMYHHNLQVLMLRCSLVPISESFAMSKGWAMFQFQLVYLQYLSISSSVTSFHFCSIILLSFIFFLHIIELYTHIYTLSTFTYFNSQIYFANT